MPPVKYVKAPTPPPPTPGGLGCCPFYGSGYVVFDLLFYISPIVCGDSVLVFVLVCTTLCHFYFAIILTRKRVLIVLLLLPPDVLLLLMFCASSSQVSVGWSAECGCGIS